jgi:hypothetical protein
MRRAYGLVVAAAFPLVVVAVGGLCVGGAWGQRDGPFPSNFGQPQKWPEAYTKKVPIQTVLDDEAHILLTHLHNDYDGSQQSANASSEDVDVFSGASALRVTPDQRYSRQIQGWNWKVVEKPVEAGEYRYVRFAWKKAGGQVLMLQLFDATRGNWVRYYAGGGSRVTAQDKQVAKEPPGEWTVVTRDLFKDFGAMTVSGVAFTAIDGQHALFDHVLFGRSVAELDEATAAATGKAKPGFTLEPKYREALWEDLFDKDREKSGPAVRGLLTDAAGTVPVIADRLPPTPLSPDEVKGRAKKISTYISQLGGDTDFDTRLAAEEALDKFGPAAEPAIRSALSSGDPEVRYRAGILMRRMKLSESEGSLAAARAGRVVRILERANTTDARGLLKKMTDGVYGPEYLDPATAALARMK